MPWSKEGKQRPTSDNFWNIGLGLMRRKNSRASHATLTRQYISFFGCEPVFIAILWYLLESSKWLQYDSSIQACHLLWALHFLKVYLTESVLAANMGCTERTFRDRVWFLLDGIARLDSILVSTCM